MKITVRNQQRAIRLDMPWLKKFARLSLEHCLECASSPVAVLPRLDEVEVTIVSNDVIAQVHRRFMQIEGPTDVITFDHGEIVVGAETARDNAQRFGKGLNEETGLYITHGLLHLAGFDDKERRDAMKMRYCQEKIAAKCLKQLLHKSEN